MKEGSVKSLESVLYGKQGSEVSGKKEGPAFYCCRQLTTMSAREKTPGFCHFKFLLILLVLVLGNSFLCFY